jgi:beta-galactosidase
MPMKIVLEKFFPIVLLSLVVISVPLIPEKLSSQGAAPPAPPAILLGTSWYLEQWPESRWEADLALMQQAGVSVVRLGEFAWSRIGAG